MKNLLVLILPLTSLVACAPNVMTNEEIIAERDKCVKAGMDYEVLSGGLGTPEVYKVNCIKPKQAVQPL